MTVTRRQMLVGCCAGITALAGSRITEVVLGAETQAAADRDMLVYVFLRGGVDGLSLVAPFADQNYVSARQTLRINPPGSATNAALEIGTSQNAGTAFGLHPKASGLRDLYNGGQLAIVHACGLTNGTRSHFDAMDYIERGTPTNKNTGTGWLTRHLMAVDPDGAIPALASGSRLPDSLLASSDAIAMTYPGDFTMFEHWRYGTQQRAALNAFYAGSSSIENTGRATLNTISAIKGKNLANPYIPADDVEYPTDWYAYGFSESLKTVAQMIKADLNVQVATIDFGGWDTHEGQGYILPDLIDALSRGLTAFYNDLNAYHNRLTIVVMSEFGRRLRENRSGGTDHGHGNVMFVLGGNVNGGNIYGDWPTLAYDRLDKQVDLAITTDYRRVLSEIVLRRLSNNKLGSVFPGYANHQPMNIVKGTDPAIDYSSSLYKINVPVVRR